MKTMRCKTAILILVTGSCLIGCDNSARTDTGSSSSATGAVASVQPATMESDLFVALDTSGSAKDIHESFFSSARQLINSASNEQRVTLYRFDAKPAEFFDGLPPESEEEIAELLNRELNVESNTNGTSILKLLKSFDKRLQQKSKPVSIYIYTDCGVEGMTEAEFRQSASLVASWKEKQQIKKVTLIGVQSGHRDALRDRIFLLPDNMFEIQN